MSIFKSEFNYIENGFISPIVGFCLIIFVYKVSTTLDRQGGEDFQNLFKGFFFNVAFQARVIFGLERAL